MRRFIIKAMQMAELIDAYRVVPRLIVALYGYMLYNITSWFMMLEDPSQAQATFISVVYGASAGIFAFYANTGRKWDEFSGPHFDPYLRDNDNGDGDINIDVNRRKKR